MVSLNRTVTELLNGTAKCRSGEAGQVVFIHAVFLECFVSYSVLCSEDMVMNMTDKSLPSSSFTPVSKQSKNVEI